MALLARTLMPALLLLAGCRASPPEVLGTVEFDRITLPAPAAEHIVRIDVREGQYVPAGARIMQLETTRTQAALDTAQADLHQQQQALLELERGPREEQIRQARANLVGAQAQARDATAYYQRLSALARQQFVSAADLDRAKAAAGNAEAAVSSFPPRTSIAPRPPPAMPRLRWAPIARCSTSC